MKKSKTKFSNKFKKNYFWPILPIFGAKKFFFQNICLLRTTPHTPLTSCWVSEKINETIPRKFPDGRTEGPKDWRTKGQTLSHRTFRPQLGVQLSISLAWKIRKYIQTCLNRTCLNSDWLMLSKKYCHSGRISVT